ncbi:MAG TPA: hypothetical protein GX497_07500 [Bacillus bacterium]|nr:hypothetical protein [Bacillus sp. (in: firmicutes)]
MSLYRFIASDNPLAEVDYSGFVKMKVRDIKKIEPVPNPPACFQSWDEMDEEVTILYAKDESELGGPSISRCDNPPYGLDNYIKKDYIYWLEGDFSQKFLQQLTEYVKSVNLSEISCKDFEILRNHKCCGLKIM